MAVTASGLFTNNFINALSTTALALGLNNANKKIAIFNNTLTPDFDAAAASAAYGAGVWASNEVTGTGWAAGGVALSTPTLTISPTGTIMFDAVDVSASGVTFSGGRCALIYDNVLSPKSAVCLVNFGSDYAPTAGTFSIVWAATGIFALDVTP